MYQPIPAGLRRLDLRKSSDSLNTIIISKLLSLIENINHNCSKFHNTANSFALQDDDGEGHKSINVCYTRHSFNKRSPSASDELEPESKIPKKAEKKNAKKPAMMLRIARMKFWFDSLSDEGCGCGCGKG